MEAKHLDVAETRAVTDDSQPSERSSLPEQFNINHELDNNHEEAPLTFRRRIKQFFWDTLDYSPAERRFVSKIDFFIL
jgi:ACS family pantothenate transporter-like MFS transporter